MTMAVTVGGFGKTIGIPHFSFSATEIEDMSEEERGVYLRLLRETRQQLTRSGG